MGSLDRVRGECESSINRCGKGLGSDPRPGWLLALGYDVVTGTIEDLSQANQANGVVVVATTNGIVEGGKEAAEETAEWVLTS